MNMLKSLTKFLPVQMRNRMLNQRHETAVASHHQDTSTEGRSKIINSNAHSCCTDSCDWQPIIPFKTELLPVLPFSSDLLPQVIYDYVKQHSVRLDHAPIEYAAMSVLVASAALIGNTVKIIPKLHDTSWQVPATLWGVGIGEPSHMKTPSLKAGKSLVEHAQKTVIKKRNSELRLQHQLDKITRAEQIEHKVKLAKQASENDNELLARQLLEEAQAINCDEPHERNVTISDFTKAALIIRFQSNPNGLLLFKEEFSGLLSVLNNVGGDELRSFLLECFDADGTYSVDRSKFGTIVIENLNISIMGGIQPSMIQPILASRSSGQKNDGFFERFSASVMPDHKGVYTDIAPDKELISQMKSLFEKLATLTVLTDPPLLRFSDEAQSTWSAWAIRLKARTLNATEQDQAILGKQAALCARLTLILHLLNEAIEHDGSNKNVFQPNAIVQAKTLEQAIKLTALFESHGRRIQAYFQTEQQKSAASILLSNLTVFVQPFSLRDLTRKAWRGLSTTEACQAAINELVKRNYIREVEIAGTNNRVLKRYEVNPAILPQ